MLSLSKKNFSRARLAPQGHLERVKEAAVQGLRLVARVGREEDDGDVEFLLHVDHQLLVGGVRRVTVKQQEEFAVSEAVSRAMPDDGGTDQTGA